MKSKEQLKRDTALVLRQLREKKSKDDDIRLTQTDIAEYAEMSVRYYNKLEGGKTMPTIDTISKIANAYKMTMSDLCKLIDEY